MSILFLQFLLCNNTEILTIIIVINMWLYVENLNFIPITVVKSSITIRSDSVILLFSFYVPLVFSQAFIVKSTKCTWYKFLALQRGVLYIIVFIVIWISYNHSYLTSFSSYFLLQFFDAYYFSTAPFIEKNYCYWDVRLKISLQWLPELYHYLESWSALFSWETPETNRPHTSFGTFIVDSW